MIALPRDKIFARVTSRKGPGGEARIAPRQSSGWVTSRKSSVPGWGRFIFPLVVTVGGKECSRLLKNVYLPSKQPKDRSIAVDNGENPRRDSEPGGGGKNSLSIYNIRGSHKWNRCLKPHSHWWPFSSSGGYDAFEGRKVRHWRENLNSPAQSDGVQKKSDGKSCKEERSPTEFNPNKIPWRKRRGACNTKGILGQEIKSISLKIREGPGSGTTPKEKAGWSKGGSVLLGETK